jgi:hypothetical protein
MPATKSPPIAATGATIAAHAPKTRKTWAAEWTPVVCKAENVNNIHTISAACTRSRRSDRSAIRELSLLCPRLAEKREQLKKPVSAALFEHQLLPLNKNERDVPERRIPAHADP